MLSDPLVVIMFASGLSSAHAAVVDGIADLAVDGAFVCELHTTDNGAGSSKRRGVMLDGTRVSLNISHSTSKENAPLVTDRVLVRYDLTRTSAITGKPVTMSAYAVTTLPQDGTFSPAEAASFAEALACFLLVGGKRDAGAGSARPFDALDGDTVRRLLGGEA